MAFDLYKGNANGTAEMIRCLSGAAITKGMLVALDTQQASATDVRPKVIPLVGATDSAVRTFGVAVESVADATELLVIPADSQLQFLADGAADSNHDDLGADNVLAADTQLVTIGTSTVMGKKCEILGFSGTAAQRKYIVRLCNHVFDSEDKTDAT